MMSNVGHYERVSDFPQRLLATVYKDWFGRQLGIVFMEPRGGSLSALRYPIGIGPLKRTRFQIVPQQRKLL